MHMSWIRVSLFKKCFGISPLCLRQGGLFSSNARCMITAFQINVLQWRFDFVALHSSASFKRVIGHLMPYYSRRRRREFPLLNKFAEPRLLQPDVRQPSRVLLLFGPTNSWHCDAIPGYGGVYVQVTVNLQQYFQRGKKKKGKTTHQDHPIHPVCVVSSP